MNIEDFKTTKSSNKKVKRKLKKNVINFINRALITGLLFVIALIVARDNNKIKDFIQKNVYEKNFEFTEANKLYQKYFGKYLAIKEPTKDQTVFTEKLDYKKTSLYKDGVKLDVSDNYMVPFLESGIVVFMGEKEEYGTTVIVQQINGIDVWYCNINAKDIKMYDYVEKGKLLGESKSNKMYLVFQKDGKFLNYKEYI